MNEQTPLPIDPAAAAVLGVDFDGMIDDLIDRWADPPGEYDNVVFELGVVKGLALAKKQMDQALHNNQRAWDKRRDEAAQKIAEVNRSADLRKPSGAWVGVSPPRPKQNPPGPGDDDE